MPNVEDKDLGYKRIVEEMDKMNDKVVKVGFLSTAEPYTRGNGESATVAQVASFQEYGVPYEEPLRIPKRPFMANTFDKNEPQVNRIIEDQQNKIYEGRETTDGALKKLGTFYKGRIQNEITEGEYQQNKQSTIDKKGSEHPLIDTGHMRQSVNFEIAKRSESGDGNS